MPGAESDGLNLGPHLGLGALGSLGLTTGDGRPGGGGASALQAVRSNTIENILRETLSGGKELEDLMMDWGQGAAQQEVRGRGVWIRVKREERTRVRRQGSTGTRGVCGFGGGACGRWGLAGGWLGGRVGREEGQRLGSDTGGAWTHGMAWRA